MQVTARRLTQFNRRQSAFNHFNTPPLQPPNYSTTHSTIPKIPQLNHCKYSFNDLPHHGDPGADDTTDAVDT